jgi:hypothetical protein
MGNNNPAPNPTCQPAPSISTRRGIAWGFSPPYEDTSTLVLTSPAGRFVDIRFPLSATSTTTSSGISVHDATSFWAFSGTSSSTRPQAGEFPAWPHATHSVWTHEIDSRGPGIVDEGDVFELANGDFMEVGSMVEPGGSGWESLYKEYWTEPEDAGQHGTEGFVAELVDSGEGRRRGRVILLGGFAQVIWELLRGKEEEVVEVHAVRWTKVGEEWEKTVCCRDHGVEVPDPSEWLGGFGEEREGNGAEIVMADVKGSVWKIIETW